MDISYLSAKWCSNEKQAILFEGLIVEGEDFGNFIADTTTDIGKALLQHVKAHGCSITEVQQASIAPSINISQNQAIKNITSWFYNYVDTQAQTKSYADANTCISYLFSTNETYKKEANVFLKWRDNATTILNQFIEDFKLGKISILDFNTENLLKKLPPFNWIALDSLYADLDAFFQDNIVQEDTFLDKKAAKYNDIKKEYLRLKGLNCSDTYFNSSVQNLYINGDLQAKINIEALLATVDNNKKIHFRAYSNFWVDLTKSELQTIYKELLQNQVYLTTQYWEKTQRVMESESEAELAKIDISFEGAYFGSRTKESDLRPEY